ncbi:glycosyltransferase [Chitinophaga pinensis]|uniref:Glycosyl transferase family 1 domain-containing protein n=1 Tax=Chitinophaga pinensis (strain ATCC 43595 / DSM 2588 / LMG 13176 / NBRC 15968 / NCIMB 11800 / UQM 2034) TaxID=485918 RepID=A0A979GXR8_CHIPD|nr:glycosyltransferase [Chitinophaga pinensis]ACU62616.1 conserved hypothetical protein [Chitinophaga pinensis DSM 2588]
MHVTIVGRENGVGLEKDKKLLVDLLTRNSIRTDFRSIDEYVPLHKDNDISIFTEIVDKRYFGRKNILIPNQEWFYKRWLPFMHRFDVIFCKTFYAQKIFSAYHSNVTYTGFTSLDCYIECEKKPEYFHSQGKSQAKGTQFVVSAWETSKLPKIHLISEKYASSGDNVIMYEKLLPEQEYNRLRNECLIHIYPSQAEGFGHCINEARSCGAVVVSTDFPPMNEIATDFLVPIHQASGFCDRLGASVSVKPSSIIEVLNKLSQREDLPEIGARNRYSFLEADRSFREKFLYEINRI